MRRDRKKRWGCAARGSKTFPSPDSTKRQLRSARNSIGDKRIFLSALLTSLSRENNNLIGASWSVFCEERTSGRKGQTSERAQTRERGNDYVVCPVIVIPQPNYRPMDLIHWNAVRNSIDEMSTIQRRIKRPLFHRPAATFTYLMPRTWRELRYTKCGRCPRLIFFRKCVYIFLLFLFLFFLMESCVDVEIISNIARGMAVRTYIPQLECLVRDERWYYISSIVEFTYGNLLDKEEGSD